MSANASYTLHAAAVIATDTTTVSEAQEIHFHSQGFILESVVTARTDGTFTTTLQMSADKVNWFSVLDDENVAVAGAAQSTDSAVIKIALSNVPLMKFVRASILSSSTTSGATIRVELHHGINR